MSKAKTRFKPGDTVRVVGERGTSRIRWLLPAVNGALLETEIGGFRNWNLDELRLVKRVERKRSKMTESSRARIKAAGLARERKTKPPADAPADAALSRAATKTRPD